LLLVLRNSSVDPRYIEVPLHHGKKLWTLRVSEKEGQSIKLVETLHSDAGDHSQSSAHAELLKKLFKIKAKLYKSDNLTELIFARYPI